MFDDIDNEPEIEEVDEYAFGIRSDEDIIDDAREVAAFTFNDGDWN